MADLAQEHAYLRVPETVPAALAAADLARPLLTWYDDGTGERVELSGATLGNWVAKTANLLVDGCGLGAGNLAVVDAPPHWQTAAVLLGCWSAGLQVALASAPDADVVFAAADRAGGYAATGAETYGAEVYGLALAPMAAPMPQPPAGVVDYVREVRGHGDEFRPVEPVLPEHAATPGDSHAGLCRAAGHRAAGLGIGAGARVLVDAASHPDPRDWLLAPLVAGASTVLCANLDAAALPGRISTERVTVTVAAGGSPPHR